MNTPRPFSDSNDSRHTPPTHVEHKPQISTWLLGGVVGLVVAVVAPRFGVLGLFGGAIALFLIISVIVSTTRASLDPAAQQQALSLRRRLEDSRSTHRSVIAEYGQWELDPEQMLEYPGLWDYSRPEVQRFFDAMARANQLESQSITEETPASAEEYINAVQQLRSSWHEATRYALSAGTGFMDATNQQRAIRALKLWRHSTQAATAEEAASFAQRARDDIAELVKNKYLPGTLRAVSAIEHSARGQLER